MKVKELLKSIFEIEDLNLESEIAYCDVVNKKHNIDTITRSNVTGKIWLKTKGKKSIKGVGKMKELEIKTSKEVKAFGITFQKKEKWTSNESLGPYILNMYKKYMKGTSIKAELEKLMELVE